MRGRLVADQARIQVPESAPGLGEEVVVNSAPGTIATAEQRKKREPRQHARPAHGGCGGGPGPGPRLRVTGRGIDTRLRGTLSVAAESFAQPRLGTIRTVGGEFHAYNQQLDIERGVLRSPGRWTTPRWTSWRCARGLGKEWACWSAARAGACPLYSRNRKCPMPRSWRCWSPAAPRPPPAPRPLVQQAALALLSARQGGGSGGIAGRFGLDALSAR